MVRIPDHEQRSPGRVKQWQTRVQDRDKGHLDKEFFLVIVDHSPRFVRQIAQEAR